MTSVSELIGLVVINIYPTNSLDDSRREPRHRTKSSDATLGSDAEAQAHLHTADETLAAALNHEERVSSLETVRRSKTPEPRNRNALFQLDFWVMALIMASCTIRLHS